MGIGLTLYERPIISRAYSLDDPLVFEKNMTFAIETQQGEEGVGGARLEEMVVVTDTGYEMMTRWPSEEITVVQHSLVGKNRHGRSSFRRREFRERGRGRKNGIKTKEDGSDETTSKPRKEIEDE